MTRHDRRVIGWIPIAGPYPLSPVVRPGSVPTRRGGGASGPDVFMGQVLMVWRAWVMTSTFLAHPGSSASLLERYGVGRPDSLQRARDVCS